MAKLFGVVRTNGMKISSIVEKPIIKANNAGMYVLSKDATLSKDTFYDILVVY